ncbi:MAG: hypothetical protein OXR72_20625 [Gemmatimonadota bacterium]|nr:hypothetical protein [Gemmatimonadota bacterium]
MRSPIRAIFYLCVTTFPTAVGLSVVQASIDLPPEMMADKYLIKAEQLHAKEDYAAALKVMEKVIALQKEHGIKLPDGFHFKYARASLSAGSVKIALESIDRYLSETGREGEFYRDALALLLEFEETRISAEESCTGKPEGAVCWKDLANHPHCFIWDSYYYEDQAVTWSGKRYGSLAHGEGTLIWTRGDESHSETGRLERGKKQGHWIVRGGGTSEGLFVDGKRQGQWVTRWDDGGKQRGEYVDGKAEGRWLSFRSRRPTGERCSAALFRNNVQVTEWSYVYDSMCDF